MMRGAGRRRPGRATRRKAPARRKRHGIIDAHVHVELSPEDQKERIETNGINPSFEGLLLEMKQSRIERAVLLSEDQEENEALAKMNVNQNKILLAMYVDPMNTHSPEYHNYIDNHLKNGTFRALKLYPGYEHFYPSDDKCKPVFQLASQHKVPVVIHTGDTHTESREMKPRVKYAKPDHIDDVAVEFPDAKIVIAHAGNPWVHDAAEVAYKNPNVFVDISGWFVGKTEKRDMKVFTHNLNFLLSYVSADKIIYGSDWPLVRLRDYLSFAKSTIKAKRAELEKIMYKNALKVYWNQ